MPRSARSGDDEPGHDAEDDGEAAVPAAPAPAPEAELELDAAQGDPAAAVAQGDPPPHPERGEPVEPTPDNLEARAELLRELYGPYGLSVLVERPFVLVGDEGPGPLRRRAEGTVRWAVERLERAYFGRPPADIVEVWLLGDDDSYQRHAWSVFGERPDTPYGYFTPTHQVLIMNIGTGGGTLVHEMVHPYVDADFPRCPAWFNEGLASLYEQCSEVDGEIWGLTNWRLAGLQDTIRAGRLPSFTTLLSTTRDEFYEDDPGSNYAQARYLCYHLQEQGKLREFYREFRRDVAKDATGLATLRAHVGRDLKAFQQQWERWVLTLRYG